MNRLPIYVSFTGCPSLTLVSRYRSSMSPRRTRYPLPTKTSRLKLPRTPIPCRSSVLSGSPSDGLGCPAGYLGKPDPGRVVGGGVGGLCAWGGPDLCKGLSDSFVTLDLPAGVAGLRTPVQRVPPRLLPSCTGRRK